eukprot:c47174_g1_i1 orf=158-586(+)
MFPNLEKKPLNDSVTCRESQGEQLAEGTQNMLGLLCRLTCCRKIYFGCCYPSLWSSKKLFAVSVARFLSSSEWAGTCLEEGPPVAKKRPFFRTAHGITWVDPYHWLSDRNDPAVRKHLENENRYADAVMADTLHLQQQLQEE